MQAIIFDFDGLILDTETPAFEAWSAIYAEHGVRLPLSEWVKCVGASDDHFDPVRYLEQLLGRSLDRAALMGDKDQRKRAICDALLPMPGVRARIEEARALKLKIAVASSSSQRWVHGHLQRLGMIGEFDAIRTKDDVARVKPFPDLYLAAAAALEVSPTACLVFEDSVNGVRAAVAAGMRVIAVPGPVTKSLDFSGAEAVVDSLGGISLSRLMS